MENVILLEIAEQRHPEQRVPAEEENPAAQELHPDRRVQTAEKLQVIALLPEHREEETILLWMKRYTDFHLKE